MCSLHSYMGYTQPLFIWGIMGLKNLYDTKSVIIYILGQEVEGDLKGPFMGSMFRGEFVFFSFLFLSFFGGGFFVLLSTFYLSRFYPSLYHCGSATQE